MASEAQVRVGFQIVVNDSFGSVNFHGLPSGFNADVAGRMGPYPGSVLVTTDGIDVDLSPLGTPGWCWLANQAPVDGASLYVDIGIRDDDSNTMYSLLAIKPGQAFPVFLSPNMLKEYPGTGTGASMLLNRLHLKAHGAAANVFVGAFSA